MNLYNNKKTAFLFMLPALVIILIFIYFPILENFVYSLYRWSSFSLKKEFVGLQNYFRLFKDPVFYQALKNNILYCVISIIFQVGIGLIIAAILEEKFFRKYQKFFRCIYFMPSVISITVIGLLFQLIYNPSIGLLNRSLIAVGLENLTHTWLGEKQTAMYAVIAVSQWQSIGYIMLLFLVAIQKIPVGIYESAIIDGANGWQKFWKITVPQVKNTIFLASILTIIGGFKVFDEVYVMTAGGPGRATELLASYLYRSGFRNDEMGYASAIASIIFIITFVITLIQLKINEKEKNYK
ncbi:sugar ABC transporter permease [Fusobacterium necrophorum]|uniref:ABC transporter permease n=3 Tax=Fusobacterium necrophorum TaxID=859 RepID=A0AB73BYU3_9FUSO|nr:sugar ABC transporter permease [Fusobacterium necrophorum]AZW10025.1 sugar ABC transporter permease [Fusobacterium necrophorum subsp. necrophorum]KDE65547.1 ABC transporter permease [Fusobacterium necrophorum DJ-1]KDE74836.1 ABC transporter permease [Fusobacterium necrophorum BFTR-2]AYZ74096.1 sugar ABC transporter permease [Fusobacterium necrophorum]KDE63612.1 ABC transporter permease [Fusobacterium necrophorum BFTR-1]